MGTFKSVAYEVLLKAGHPMHVGEITRYATERGWLKTAGKTPQATMAAALYVDVNEKGKRSLFVFRKPSYFALNPAVRPPTARQETEEELPYPLSKDLSSKQKGDIAEARISELITLYGETALSCYRPISDDEGIDLIVKKKGLVGSATFLQVKSRFGIAPGSPFTQNVRLPKHSGANLGIVFCHFNTEVGDLWEYLWFVPYRDLVRMCPPAKDGLLHFVAGMNRRGSSRHADYLINKRGLANRILEFMR